MLLTGTPELQERAEQDLSIDIPEGLSELFDAFLVLDGQRGSNGFGANAFTDALIETCSRMRGWVLGAWDIDTLMAADQALLRAQHDTKTKEKTP